MKLFVKIFRIIFHALGVLLLTFFLLSLLLTVGLGLTGQSDIPMDDQVAVVFGGSAILTGVLFLIALPGIIRDTIRRREQEQANNKSQQVKVGDAYCPKCKERVDIMGTEKTKDVTLKNGRPAIKGHCKTCGTGVYSICGRPA